MNEIEQKEICENCKKRNNCNHRELIHKDGCSVHDCDCYCETIDGEKQIEEMARVLKTARETYFETDMFINSPYTPTEYYSKMLIEKGYRNCKDKVVLSKEEWKTVCDNMSNAESQGRKINDMYGQCLIENQILKEELRQASELRAETIKLAKRETAREILKALKNMAYQSNDWSHGIHPMVVEVDSIEEIAEQYGVEVE